MSINVLFNIEHYTMPQVFYSNKTNFFMGSAYNKGFLHETFNSFYENAFEKGFVKRKRNFKEKDFKISEQTYNDKQKMMCIELPKPKRPDNADMYLKSYFISFLEHDNKIEVLNIYGLQKRKIQQNVNLIVSFVENDDKIVFRGAVKNDPKSVFSYMYKVAFEDYYPQITVSNW